MDRLQLEEALHRLSTDAEFLMDCGEGDEVDEALGYLSASFDAIKARVDEESERYEWHTYRGDGRPLSDETILIEIQIRGGGGGWDGQAVPVSVCEWIWDEEYGSSDIVEWRIAPPNLPRVELL